MRMEPVLISTCWPINVTIDASGQDLEEKDKKKQVVIKSCSNCVPLCTFYNSLSNHALKNKRRKFNILLPGSRQAISYIQIFCLAMPSFYKVREMTAYEEIVYVN